MECPSCHQPLENGAVFCGNCGYQVAQPVAPNMPQNIQPQQVTSPVAVPAPPVPQPPVVTSAAPVPAPPPSPIAQVMASNSTVPPTPSFGGYPQPVSIGGAMSNIPTYAMPIPGQKSAHTKAVIGLVLGIVGIVAGVFIPIAGLLLGIIGIVLVSLAWHNASKGLRMSGLILSILALVVGLGAWAYYISKDAKLHPTASSSNAVVGSSGVTTPCYSIQFSQKFTIDNSSGSCDVSAYNRANITDSTDAYKILGDYVASLDSATFASKIKSAIENDVQSAYPSYAVSSEGPTTFASSPAYYMVVKDASKGISIEEVAVYHETSSQNLFTIVHVIAGSSVDTADLESGWQW